MPHRARPDADCAKVSHELSAPVQPSVSECTVVHLVGIGARELVRSSTCSSMPAKFACAIWETKYGRQEGTRRRDGVHHQPDARCRLGGVHLRTDVALEHATFARMRERSTFHGSYRWKRARRVARIEAEHTCSHCGRFVPEPGALHVHHRKSVKRALSRHPHDMRRHDLAAATLTAGVVLWRSPRRFTLWRQRMMDRMRVPAYAALRLCGSPAGASCA